MRAMRKWRIEGVSFAEVIDYLTEWLEACEFKVQHKRGIFKKRIRAKTVQYAGELGTDRACTSEKLEIFFEFETSKVFDDTSLKAEYYGIRPLDGRVELGITTREVTPRSLSNPNLYYLREYARGLVIAFEKYFDLEAGMTSEWHDRNMSLSVFSDEKIHMTLTEDVMKLREIAKRLGIEKIGDIRRLHRKLVSLCESKPEVFGGAYGVRVIGGYTKRAPILEGSFWRRDFVKS